MQNIHHYNQMIKKLRYFFQEKKGFIEVPSQCRLSILAACEDPSTISQFSFNNIIYPLPQTGQMWLEYELLKNPGLPGVFCITTSYRNEPNPIPGRHVPVFPMFEFEAAGDMNVLRQMEAELLEYMGFGKACYLEYEDMCDKYDTDILSAKHELLMQEEFGNVISLEHFPIRSHPFWNMKRKTPEIFNKIDVLLYGMETIGSAEREVNTKVMREHFMTISKSQYAQLLFDAFGKDRVMQELDQYLSLPMFERFGGGIGLTRLERAMELAGLFNKNNIALAA